MSKSLKEQIEILLKINPGLKAKEIAVKVGAAKSEVNSCMYGNSKTFSVDENFRWYVITIKTKTVTLGSSWMNSTLCEDLLNSAGPLLEGEADTIEFIFPQGCKPMIDSLAILLSLFNQLASRKKKVILDFSRANEATTYLDRDGFFDLLDAQVMVLPERPACSSAQQRKGQSDALVEFGRVVQGLDNSSLITALSKSFICHASEKYKQAACTIFGELIHNIEEHSNTPLDGFAGLQKYDSSTRHIVTVVSDSGDGIAKTIRTRLREKHPALFKRYGTPNLENDMELVKLAFTKGGISRVNDEGRGLGLRHSEAQARKFNAKLSVRQERFALIFAYKDGELVGISSRDDLTLLKGTHICFDFFLNRS